MPTAVNNVETLCAVPSIIDKGADWFKGIGTEGSAGPKLVSVSGHIGQPGVYEIEPGITLRDFLDNVCGGVIGELQTVLMGGAAGTFLKPEDIDVAPDLRGFARDRQHLRLRRDHGLQSDGRFARCD